MEYYLTPSRFKEFFRLVTVDNLVKYFLKAPLWWTIMMRTKRFNVQSWTRNMYNQQILAGPGRLVYGLCT